MTRRKAFASDFDGTLWFNVDGRWTYRPEDMRLVRAFQGEGNLFGVSTGRSLNGVESSTQAFMDPADLVTFDFYILLNGACLRDSRHAPISLSYVPVETIRELHATYSPEARSVIQANDTVYTFDKPLSTQTRIERLEDIPGRLHGISFWVDDPTRAAEVAGAVNREHPDVVCAHLNRQTVDVVAAGCSKGRAVETIRGHFGVDAIAAIGDSYNDMSMLEAADVSFTFPHAPREVQDAASHVVESVAEAVELFMGE